MTVKWRVFVVFTCVGCTAVVADNFNDDCPLAVATVATVAKCGV